jgi:putative nucleotidyltransferase with HDIG domain
MSGASKQRSQKERIESLGIPKPRFVEWWQRSDKADGSIRIVMAVVAAVAMLVLCQTWRPPFAYRANEIPDRDLVTRVSFDVIDDEQTEAERDRKAAEQIAYYRKRSEPLNQLRFALKNQLFLVLDSPSFDQMTEEEQMAFGEFYEGDETAGPNDSPAVRFAVLKTVLAGDPELTKVDEALGIALQENYQKGLLQGLQHSAREGNQERIRVYPLDQPSEIEFVELSDARIAQAKDGIETQLKEQFRQRFEAEGSQKVAQMIYDWLVERLPDSETLTYDAELSEKARAEAAATVDPVMMTYSSGIDALADAGAPLEAAELSLLKREWEEIVGQMRWADILTRVAAYAGMIAALYLLCGSYIFFVDDRRLVLDHWKFAKLLGVMVATVTLGYLASRDQWRGELIPLVLGSIVAAVVYGRELALLLMAAASVSMTLFLGGDLSDLVMMAAACTSCTLLLGRIRSRTHLLYVGAISAIITILTVVGVGIVTGGTISIGMMASEIGSLGSMESMGQDQRFNMVLTGLLSKAVWAGFCILVSATAMTTLLPLVERGFGVQTDLSLLELGDASHALLRRLAQRAPGTYNHSINVASIAESAADAIGANGLLVRVGAYFHDIGKMFKPEYFVENQSAGVNQHDSLQPAMSTLVIIAHVKDGADLARSHHLPTPIIDFILQHHGTTLVEYFYREAARRSEENPNGEAVSDKDFRYPGPRPQTLEAAVMMLADAVESASRTLVDPTPARIKGLVDSIAQKKMADGQFDECGLTFRQLDRIRQSLVKSLTAIYHARVKYPGQQSA